MLIITRHGFFSAVQNTNDKDLIHVRARFRNDLERLCQTYSVRPIVVHTPNSYYPYRMDFNRIIWAKIVQMEAQLINYNTFESGTKDGTKRDKAYAEVLAILKKYSD